MSSACRTAVAISVLGLGLVLIPGAPGHSQEAQVPLRLMSERLVPAPIAWAFDVRWADDRTVMIAAGGKGVFEIAADRAESPPRAVVPGRATGGPWLSSRLAVSSSHLITAAPVFTLHRGRRPSLELETIGFDAIVDLDLSADRLLILGAVKDEKQNFSPDGAIAWLGPAESELKALRPVFFSRHGPGARTMAECGILDLGTARFLADGSFVLVPGVEPGVFWYDASGGLRRTWESRQLGLEDECAPVLGRSDELAADPGARNRWLNQRVIVDEILPLPDGPALVVRDVRAGTTRWRLALLKPGGAVTWLDLPITSSSGWAHLKGDVRGHRVVLLVVEYGDTVDRPVARPRLIFAELAS